MTAALLLGAFLLAASIAVYTVVAFRIHDRGGKVDASPLGLPDLFVFVALAGLFTALLLGSAGETSREITLKTLIFGIGFFGLIAAAIAGLLRYRGIRLREFMGLRQVAPGLVPTLALGFLLAAYPLIWMAGLLGSLQFGFDLQPQEMVLFYKAAWARGDHGQVIVTLFAAAICAPVIEEFIFRGYLYPALKRWAGILPAMALSAALFAAIHNNLLSLAPIFVLALCLTAAYEATGSLLVPMTMHALFNGTTLWIIMLQPTPA